MDVLVPHEAGIAALADVPGVRAIRYRPDAPMPPEADSAEVLVAPFLATGEVVAALRRLPKLRLVQLLTAGAEAWIGQLPGGVALSDCRGAHGGATAEWIVATLLATYRHLPRFATAQADGRWDYHTTEELAGKRVLIIGAGDVAEETLARLTPFDVTTTLVGRRARDGVHAIAEVAELLPRHDMDQVDAEALGQKLANPLGVAREVVEVGEAVDTDNVVALLEQRLREVRADEAGGSGDDVSHREREVIRAV